MRLSWKRFGGLRPKVASHLLPDEYAQEAHNTLLVDGRIQPLRSDALGPGGAGQKTLYRLHDAGGACGELVTFDHCVDVLPTPAPGCCGDLEAYVLWHHDGQEPEWWLPARNLRGPLIVPAPTTRLTATPLNSTTLDVPPNSQTLIYVGPEERVYTYTWVDQFGVESRPAPPSVAVKTWDDVDMRLSGFDVAPPNAVALRIYRTAASFDDGSQVNNPLDTSFQLVAELEPPFPSTWDDTVRGKDLELGTLLTFEDSPVPEMDQVVVTEAGYMVGFKDNDLFISERYEPWNWPSRYRHNLPDRIIRLVAQGEWVYIITSGHPYRVRPQFLMQDEGTDLESHLQMYPDPLPGTGRLAACVVPWGAAYVSRKGLVVLTPQRAQLITPARIGLEQWHDWAPNIMEWHDGRLVCFRSPAGRGFIFDLPEEGGELDPGDLVTVDNPGVVALHEGRDGVLYYATPDNVFLWGEGQGAKAWRWRSKRVVLDEVLRFGAVRVRCTGTVTFTLFVDGEAGYRHQVRNTTTFRLPFMRRGREFEVLLEGDEQATVYQVDVASSVGELTG